ncbi:MAG: hypothetical protein AAGF68_10670 [Pseudomonadota bacterium]
MTSAPKTSPSETARPEETPYGWCPSVLRPMPLSDGLMVRIRPWMGTLTRAQAEGLADLASRYGAGVVELTNRANLQLRGLSQEDHAALVPQLDDLGLSRVDRSPSRRVNVTIDPFRAPGGGMDRLARALSERLSEARWSALPEKFGFLIDAGRVRRLDGIAGDIRIEACGDALLLRQDGAPNGLRLSDVTEAVEAALAMAAWFINSGAIGLDGRGRMAQAKAKGLTPPSALTGDDAPNPAEAPALAGAAFLHAVGGTLTADALAQAAASGPFRVTPYRALLRFEGASASHLVSEEASWNNAP